MQLSSFVVQMRKDEAEIKIWPCDSTDKPCGINGRCVVQPSQFGSFHNQTNWAGTAITPLYTTFRNWIETVLQHELGIRHSCDSIYTWFILYTFMQAHVQRQMQVTSCTSSTLCYHSRYYSQRHPPSLTHPRTSLAAGVLTLVGMTVVSWEAAASQPEGACHTAPCMRCGEISLKFMAH